MSSIEILDAGSEAAVRPGTRVRRYFHPIGIPILAALIALQVISVVAYVQDDRYLKDLVDRVAPESLPASQQALAINAFLRPKPAQSNKSYFLLPIFRFLRPTARQVAEQGGNCADRSRLTIALLEQHGIHASKWALYTPKMEPHHAVVELDAENGKMVLDPLFGLVFPRPDGGYYDIATMRQDPSILHDRVMALRAEHARPGADRLEWYPLDDYIYTNARSINWDKLLITRLLYRVLHSIMGDRVDRLSRPDWVERPSLVVIAGIGLLELVLLFFWSLIQWRWRGPRAPTST